MKTKTTQPRTRRCRCGACSNLALPPAPYCAACRRVRIAFERQRQAADLAKATHCQVASEIISEVTP